MNKEKDQLEKLVYEPTVEIVETCSFQTDKLCMNAGMIHDDDQFVINADNDKLFLLSDGQITEFIAGVENQNYVLITDDEMVTTESLASESIEDCTESFSKEMIGLWHELSVLEQRLEVQKISVQNIKTEMNENKEVHFYEPEHRGILGEDDAEERLSDSLKNDWDQHTEILAMGSKALKPYDFYLNKCFVNAGIGTEEHLNQLSSQMKGEEVFCSRRQEGMDDWVAVRTETSIEARSQQVIVQIERVKTEQAVLAQQTARNQPPGELLDQEIESIRGLMMKVSRKRPTAVKPRRSSKRKKTENCESLVSGAMQHKVGKPGEE